MDTGGDVCVALPESPSSKHVERCEEECEDLCDEHDGLPREVGAVQPKRAKSNDIREVRQRIEEEHSLKHDRHRLESVER